MFCRRLSPVFRGNLKPEMPESTITLHQITAAEAIPIRAEVLRSGLPLSAASYICDEHPAVYHAGAYVDGKLIGVATVFPDLPPKSENELAWRLRGMAVCDNFRGLGIGRLLLGNCIEHVGEMGGNLLWCNARTPVLEFYSVMGFHPVGDEFMIPVSGPHYLMSRKIS